MKIKPEQKIGGWRVAVERSRSPTLHSANTLEGSRRKLADLGRPAAMTQDANPEHRPIAREREGEASMIRRLVPTATPCVVRLPSWRERRRRPEALGRRNRGVKQPGPS